MTPERRAHLHALLVLRHLYDGDAIDYPLPDEVPQAALFAELERQGLIARWSRMWPLGPRYRLTEKGIAALEQVYRPDGAEAFFASLRNPQLSPGQRRQLMAQHRVDPFIWPVLHDPYTHWMTFPDDPGPWARLIWEPDAPGKAPKKPAQRAKGQRPRMTAAKAAAMGAQMGKGLGMALRAQGGGKPVASHHVVVHQSAHSDDTTYYWYVHERHYHDSYVDHDYGADDDWPAAPVDDGYGVFEGGEGDEGSSDGGASFEPGSDDALGGDLGTGEGFGGSDEPADVFDLDAGASDEGSGDAGAYAGDVS